MRSLHYLYVVILSILFVSITGRTKVFAQDSKEDRPNILMIYVDDLDHKPFGFMGNKIIQTPNIDQLAGEGVVFSNAFAVTATCITSRGNLMIGRYAARTGIYFDQFDELTEQQVQMSYPAQLRKAGYHTGYVGKWHLGPVPEGVFDDDRRFSGQGRFWSEEEPPNKGVHLTDKLGNQAAEMIREAPDGKPFVLTIGFKAPHVQDGFHPVEPYPPSPATAVLYELDEIPAPPLSDSTFFNSQPELIRKSLGRVRWEYRLGPPESLNFQRSLRRYYRMVTGVDNQVGKMVDALRETGQLENTIIVLTGDHGMYLGDRGLAGKWLGHETSIRVPLIVRHPGVPESGRGTQREQMVLMLDFMPTFLDWAGLTPEDGVQGRSFAPIIKGQNPENWRTEFFYEHHSFPDRIPRSEGVRTERYKYLRYLDSEPLYEELYDLQSDPTEKNNLANDANYSELLKKMRGKWQQWREDVK
ncbi:sulfatase [Aliifodinibius sp. S!AR15-10]|uniref:sulfatase family protein n=1 Tax=Aliifodinibius sp. S!AR15-10 TaxID=2950437 RepID=UPI00285CCEB3|nr:sulfatase [Aliifodinibius sp. S!AR15-10]MDR8390916.1 sulfatase [Aliifodinibius sp. S!AR15-10]